MVEISVKEGPIVIKKSYGFDFGGDICSYVHKQMNYKSMATPFSARTDNAKKPSLVAAVVVLRCMCGMNAQLV